ncbi:MAG: metallopeptidase family protein [Candidatus Levyibacteriota bacterium]
MMNEQEFEAIIRKTINALPPNFKEQLENVEITVEDEPPNPSLLGLYHGVPKTARNSYSTLPDKITIYRLPLLQISGTREEAENNIRKTVLHEIGHHFGLSDQELYRLKQLR